MLREILKELFPFALSAIKGLIESKVVPAAKRRLYERFDDIVNDKIEDLVELKEKAEITEDSVKKSAHLEGLKLGSAAIRAIGNKLIKAADALDA